MDSKLAHLTVHHWLLPWLISTIAACSSRVELGVETQFDSGVGGFASAESNATSAGSANVVVTSPSTVIATGGTAATATNHASGGTAPAKTNAQPTTGGSTGLSQLGDDCMLVSKNYVITEGFHGYAYTFTDQGTASSPAAVVISPSCDATGCTQDFATHELCAAGHVGVSSDSSTLAGITFNINQQESDEPTGNRGAMLLSRSGLMVDYINNSGDADSKLRVQLNDIDWVTYCFELSPASGTFYIPWGYFKTACWDNSGAVFSPTVPIASIQLVVPGKADTDTQFNFCLQCVQHI